MSLNEILMSKNTAENRADRQMGDNPNTEPYMDSMAIFQLTYVICLVAEELNQMNVTLANIYLDRRGER